jgi:PKD repeat protein
MKRILLSSIVIFLLSLTQIYAATYYVDANNGHNSNDGLSMSTAWRTISKVNSSFFNPGDRIYFKRNQEWRETLTISSSGAQESPIIFNAFGNGDDPIINGSDLMTGWTQYSSNIWRANCFIQPNVVFFDGTKGNKQSSIDRLNSKKEWHWNSNVLYVYSSSHPNTNYTSPGIEAGARNLCINISNNDHIIIDGLHVTKSNMDGISEYSYADRTDVTIQNCECSYNYRIGIRYTVRSDATSTDLNINNNESHHNNYDDGNDIFTSAIYISGGPNKVLDPQIYNNYTHDNLGDGIRVSGCLNGDVYGNISIHDGHSNTYTSSAWMIGGASKNVHFYNNYALDPGGEGMFIGQSSQAEGGHKFYYNIIDSPGDCGITIARYDDNCEIYNNTFYKCTAYAVRLGSDTKVTGTIVKNNIADQQRDYNVSLENSATAAIDYNCWDENYGFYENGSVRSLSQWQARGYDVNSLYQDPALNNPTNYDFTLNNNSSCINAGTDVGLSQDYQGTSVPQGYYPEMGAYEYTGSNPLSTALDASPLSGWAPLTVNFDGSASGGTSPYSYSWKFGDGSSSLKQNPEHTYSESGSYTVTLTVTDDMNNQDSDSIIINVSSSSEEFTLNLSSRTGTPAPAAGGATDPQSGSYSYTSGSDVQVTASTYKDYRFSSWNGDVNSFNKILSFSMDSNMSLTANFCTKAGDVNGDLNVSPADAQTVFDIYLGKISNPTHCQKENGDVNCDGTRTDPLLSPSDAQAIFEKYLGINNLPCDCSGNSRKTSSTLEVRNGNLQGINLFINDFYAEEGENIIVPVIIDNSYSIDSFGFDIHFPSESLEFLGTARSGMLKDFQQADGYELRSGTIRIGGYSTIPVTSQSSGDLISLIFKVKKEIKEPQDFFITNGVDDFKNVNTHSGRFLKDGKLNKK